MKLPVFEIVRATWRDLFGFVRRHPLALAVTLVCALPMEYCLARFLDDADGHGVAEAFVSALADAVALAIWSPCLFASVREAVTAQPTPLGLRNLLPPTAARYLGLSFALIIPTLPAQSLSSAHSVFALPAALLAIASIFIMLRTTLGFTALALGLREPSLSSSYRMTAGKTLRLLAILTLSLLSIGTLLVLIMFGASLAMIDIAEPILAAALLGGGSGTVYLTCAVAGAHIFRAMLPQSGAQAQNGKY